ncbi:hypothetical protein RHMOL_Rhmol11G0185100 [Rhododendron molle]|uniref:Uncharacterized protein n=1 Tax=Rhododendron molle TaxID=49168 RepID=A0ACC0LUR6_RHOML|nr:hypothetical protein RHMOL_Rhmol11G0185100 [Rhododendron molle]
MGPQFWTKIWGPEAVASLAYPISRPWFNEATDRKIIVCIDPLSSTPISFISDLYLSVLPLGSNPQRHSLSCVNQRRLTMRSIFSPTHGIPFHSLLETATAVWQQPNQVSSIGGPVFFLPIQSATGRTEPLQSKNRPRRRYVSGIGRFSLRFSFPPLYRPVSVSAPPNSGTYRPIRYVPADI